MVCLDKDDMDALINILSHYICYYFITSVITLLVLLTFKLDVQATSVCIVVLKRLATFTVRLRETINTSGHAVLK